MALETLVPTSVDASYSFGPSGGGIFPRGQQYYAAEPDYLVFGAQNGYAYGSGVTNLVGLPGSITQVLVKGTASIFTAASPPDEDAQVFLGLRLGGSLYRSITHGVNNYDGPVAFSIALTINPRTGVAWTPADIEGMGWYAGADWVSHHGVGVHVDSLAFDVTYVALAIPAAPSGLGGSVSGFSVNLNWADNSLPPNGEDSFRIERCTGGACSTFAEIAFVGPNVTSYLDAGLTPGAYRYRVKARNAAGDSAASNIADILVAADPFVTIMVPGPAAASAGAPTPVLMANTIVVPDSARASARMLRPIGLAQSLSDPLVGHGRLGYRDNMRTYRDLINDKNGRGSSKVEFLPGYEIPPTDWSVYDAPSGTYQRSLAIIVDAALRDIEGVEMGITPYSLTRQESRALCVATANSYFYDRVARVLYCRMPGGVSPTTTTTLALIGLFWSTEKESHPVLGANKLINPDMDWY